MGVRITDLYEVEDYRSALDLPFEELCRREGWTAPWLAARSSVVEPPNTVERIQSAVDSPEGES